MTYSHLRADCRYTGIISGLNARSRVWEAFTFYVLLVTDVEQTLRRDLRRTKALLQDAQMMLQRGRDTAGSRTTVKQLRNQVPADGEKFSLCLTIFLTLIIVSVALLN